jgi:uncharacterized integral membrane protein
MASPSPYKRRKPTLRKLRLYLRLVTVPIVLGPMLWFIWANNTTVTVSFPFGIGKLTSTTGLVILLSALVGSLATGLIFTMFFAVRRIQASNIKEGTDSGHEMPDDRPPADYAAKTTEGFEGPRWS